MDVKAPARTVHLVGHKVRIPGDPALMLSAIFLKITSRLGDF